MSKKGTKISSDNQQTKKAAAMTSSSNGGKAAPSGGSARPPANAWNQPLRTKANQPPPPGMGVAGKAGGGGKNQNAAGANNSSNNSSGTNHGNIQNALRERFIGLSLNMVGQKVVVSQTNGAVFEGIFHTFSPFAGLPAETKNKYVIKACRVIKQPEDKRSKLEDQATVIVSADKVACLTVKSLRIDTLTGNNNNNNKNGGQSNKKSAADAFRTDTEISGGRMDRNREFVAAGSAWTSAAGGGGGGNSRAEALMGDEGASSKRNNRGFNSAPNSKAGGLEESIGEWDQFRANQELFNVKGNYDENLYTTELDKSQMNKEQLAEAERLAREIESTTTSNIHLAEERGQILQGDYDEEDLYSGVLKDGSVKPVIRSKANADAGKGKAAAPKKMNYAAAAAKADVGKKVAPPGFASKAKGSTLEKATDKEPAKVTPEDEKKTTTKDTAEAAPATKEAGKANTEEKKDVKAGVKPTDEKEADKIEDSTKGATKGAKSEEKPAEAPAPKPASKLNANAKEFTLNPSAKTFTPGGGMAAGAAAATQDAQYVDPNAAMHMGQIPPHMQGQPHYMHVPMGQPGMMPMMPQYRYPNAYGVDQQHMAQMQAQMQPPQHMQQGGGSSVHGSGAASPGPGSEEGSAAQQAQQDGESSQQSQSSAPAQPQQQQQQPQLGQGQQQHQQVPVPYGVPPPGAYYGGGMPMHPRGPGGPHPGYHPQFVGAPQQMPGNPYRHMYPMQGGMPPNVQVRGPGGPYYGGPMGPVPYPPGAYGMMEGDDQNFRGGRGGGRGRGRTGRGGRGRGRGGRGYNFQYHSGRGQNQNGPQGAQSSEGGEWQQPIGDDAGNAPQQTNASAEPVAPAPTPETQPAQT